MQRALGRGSTEPQEIPISLDEFRHEINCILNIMARIQVASDDITQVYLICFGKLKLTTIILTSEKKVVFIYCHVEQSVCPPEISLERDLPFAFI